MSLFRSVSYVLALLYMMFQIYLHKFDHPWDIVGTWMQALVCTVVGDNLNSLEAVWMSFVVLLWKPSLTRSVWYILTCDWSSSALFMQLFTSIHNLIVPLLYWVSVTSVFCSKMPIDLCIRLRHMPFPVFNKQTI